MANLMVKTPDGKTRTVALLKRITSIGRGGDNDVQLEDEKVPESALHIMFDGKDYQVGGGSEFMVNGKKRAEAVLTTNDVISVGATELTFGTGSAPLASPALVTKNRDSISQNPDAATVE